MFEKSTNKQINGKPFQITFCENILSTNKIDLGGKDLFYILGSFFLHTYVRTYVRAYVEKKLPKQY